MSEPTTLHNALTIDQFHAAGVSAILDAHPHLVLNDLRHPLHIAANLASADSRGPHAAILKLMSETCSMALQPSVKTAPLAPFVNWGDGTGSMGPEHLQPEDLDFIASVADVITHRALRARLGDLVWLKAKRHGNRFALRAIDDYRAAPLDHSTWHTHGSTSWHRALQLAVSLRSVASERLEAMVTELTNAFFDHKDNEGVVALAYLRPLEAERLGKSAAQQIAAQLALLARREADRPHAFHAAAYSQSAIDWFKRVGDKAGAAAMLALLGETWERHGDATPAPLTRHAFYQDAIVAYRGVAGRFRDAHDVPAALERARLKYEQAGRDSVGEMISVPMPAFDVTDLVRAATEHVQREDSLQALYAFCELDTTPVKSEHMARAQATLGESFVARLFGVTTLDGDGRAVVRTTAPAADTASEEDPRVVQEAMLDFVRGAELIARAMIMPALAQIKIDHGFTIGDFQTLALCSGVVPRERADIFGKALYAGYCHDLEQALHILMPQFEHVVRQALKGAQTITATHEDGIDMEVALSALTERSQMSEVFGEDMTFAIRCLMCVQGGPNLRNAVAHGHAGAEECESPAGLYTWWFLLRLVVRQYQIRASAPSAPPVDAAS
ncbi:hypothetical protein GCM10009094_40910 [Massilia aurea]